MQRYFVSYDNGKIVFNEQDIFHIQKVMRNKVGDEIEIVYDNKAFLVAIDNLNPLNVHIVNPILNDSELPHELALFFPLTKSDKIELVIQKATEIGATIIYLYRANRSVVKLDNEAFNKKLDRFNKIAKEASEQCHRLVIPDIIGILNIKDINKYLSDLNLVAYELDAGKTSSFYDELENSKGSISFIVGPEGGFEEYEIKELEDIGFKRVSLGKRILRMETAAIYGLSIIASHMER